AVVLGSFVPLVALAEEVVNPDSEADVAQDEQHQEDDQHGIRAAAALRFGSTRHGGTSRRGYFRANGWDRRTASFQCKVARKAVNGIGWAGRGLSDRSDGHAAFAGNDGGGA